MNKVSLLLTSLMFIAFNASANIKAIDTDTVLKPKKESSLSGEPGHKNNKNNIATQDWKKNSKQKIPTQDWKKK